MKRPRKSATAKQMHRWAIYCLRGTPAAFLGSVSAADEQAAIKAAVEEFRIDDPQQQRRLIAQRQP
jgi:hypothetical protein